MNRRDFITVLGTVSASLAGCRKREPFSPSHLETFLNATLKEFRLPGLALAVVRSGEVLLAEGYGFADVAAQRPMTPDTLLNIGSISKTITATAAMQLWEQRAFQLDQDVNDFLDFPVRNPAFPDVPITFRQLLAHRSSIADGPSYAISYHCGDPQISLAEWIEGFFSPDGKYYDPANFFPWSPGAPNPPDPPGSYSNVGYGLLGRLIEVISGEDFSERCREKIFTPLGMTRSSWFLKDLDPAQHAIPYTLLGDTFELSEDSDLEGMLPREGLVAESLKPGGLFPHCLYSFYNYPDGLLRSSATELATFLQAILQSFEGGRETVLKPDTLEMMLSDQHFGRALCWARREVTAGTAFWGHSGGDPGISTYLGFQPGRDFGMVVLFNSGSPRAAHDRVYYQVIEELA